MSLLPYIPELNKTSNKMSNHIYSVPGSNSGMLMGECDSSPKNDIEHKFVEELANAVCEVMDVNHNERRIVKSLLIRSLKNSISDRSERSPGMLQQYLAHELETIADRVKRDLKIPKEIKVNHDHSTHAKFLDISRFIQENWVRKEDINSDGTFQCINDKGLDLMGECDEEICCDQACESEG